MSGAAESFSGDRVELSASSVNIPANTNSDGTLAFPAINHSAATEAIFRGGDPQELILSFAHNIELTRLLSKALPFSNSDNPIKAVTESLISLVGDDIDQAKKEINNLNLAFTQLFRGTNDGVSKIGIYACTLASFIQDKVSNSPTASELLSFVDSLIGKFFGNDLKNTFSDFRTSRSPEIQKQKFLLLFDELKKASDQGLRENNTQILLASIIYKQMISVLKLSSTPNEVKDLIVEEFSIELQSEFEQIPPQYNDSQLAFANLMALNISSSNTLIDELLNTLIANSSISFSAENNSQVASDIETILSFTCLVPELKASNKIIAYSNQNTLAINAKYTLIASVRFAYLGNDFKTEEDKNKLKTFITDTALKIVKDKDRNFQRIGQKTCKEILSHFPDILLPTLLENDCEIYKEFDVEARDILFSSAFTKIAFDNKDEAIELLPFVIHEIDSDKDILGNILVLKSLLCNEALPKINGINRDTIRKSLLRSICNNDDLRTGISSEVIRILSAWNDSNDAVASFTSSAIGNDYKEKFEQLANLLSINLPITDEPIETENNGSSRLFQNLSTQAERIKIISDQRFTLLENVKSIIEDISRDKNYIISIHGILQADDQELNAKGIRGGISGLLSHKTYKDFKIMLIGLFRNRESELKIIDALQDKDSKIGKRAKRQIKTINQDIKKLKGVRTETLGNLTFEELLKFEKRNNGRLREIETYSDRVSKHEDKLKRLWDEVKIVSDKLFKLIDTLSNLAIFIPKTPSSSNQHPMEMLNIEELYGATAYFVGSLLSGFSIETADEYLSKVIKLKTFPYSECQESFSNTLSTIDRMINSPQLIGNLSFRNSNILKLIAKGLQKRANQTNPFTKTNFNSPNLPYNAWSNGADYFSYMLLTSYTENVDKPEEIEYPLRLLCLATQKLANTYEENEQLLTINGISIFRTSKSLVENNTLKKVLNESELNSFSKVLFKLTLTLGTKIDNLNPHDIENTLTPAIESFKTNWPNTQISMQNEDNSQEITQSLHELCDDVLRDLRRQLSATKETNRLKFRIKKTTGLTFSTENPNINNFIANLPSPDNVLRIEKREEEGN